MNGLNLSARSGVPALTDLEVLVQDNGFLIIQLKRDTGSGVTSVLFEGDSIGAAVSFLTAIKGGKNAFLKNPNASSWMGRKPKVHLEMCGEGTLLPDCLRSLYIKGLSNSCLETLLDFSTRLVDLGWKA